MIFNNLDSINKFPHDNIKDKINLLDFIRSYKIGKIPIIDFLIIYVLLYIFNKMYYHFNAKTIIIATIPITIIINIVLYHNTKFGNGIIIIMIVSIFYLAYLYYHNNL